MGIKLKEAQVQGMLDGYSVIAGIGLRTGRCGFRFQRITWTGSFIESIVEFGRECSAQDAWFMLSYGEESYQQTKARTLSNISHQEITQNDLQDEMIRWLCRGINDTGCKDKKFVEKFLLSAHTAQENFKNEMIALFNDRVFTIFIPSHPLCRIEVLQDEFIIASGEQLYYLSFGWSD